MAQHNSRQAGLTLIELLIVVVIVAVMAVLVLFGFRFSTSSARDSQRKTDLETIKVALENYFNDKRCYPETDDFIYQCGDAFFTYLSKTPCDPLTNDPYLYVPLDNACQGYRLFAQLERLADPVIGSLGCDGEAGCGYGPDFNYGVSVGVPVFNPDGPGFTVTPIPTASPNPDPTINPTPTPTSAPTPPPGPIYLFACDSAGTCNQYEQGHPNLINCPVTFEQPNCNNECGNVALRCQG